MDVEHTELVGGLTRRQHEVLIFLRTYIAQHGFSPSYTDISAALGLKSKSGISRIVTALEARGMIERVAAIRGLNITAKGMAIQQGEDHGTTSRDLRG